MKDFTIFITLFFIFIAAFVAEWPPHIVIFLSISLLFFFTGIDILLKKDFKTDFALKIKDIEIKLNNLGFVLLLLSAFLFVVPFSHQEILEMKNIDALFNYKKYIANDIEGAWKVETIYWHGQDINIPKITGGSINFSRYNKSKGHIKIEIDLVANKIQKQFTFITNYRHSFDKLIINDNDMDEEENTNSYHADIFDNYNWCNPRIDLLSSILKMYWVSCYDHDDTFQLTLKRL